MVWWSLRVLLNVVVAAALVVVAVTLVVGDPVLLVVLVLIVVVGKGEEKKLRYTYNIQYKNTVFRALVVNFRALFSKTLIHMNNPFINFDGAIL